ncbi:hypothetical protein QQ008_16975 [Fulvivirgaceae bacterium BMA10]|uniref:YD repeat-containing protein n=1 Tax=Splendidivirga corallicola TaxID=3051826 RepID=A0ABT8KUC3_9BACT|nr:hypothetical protein [Fulvivirgaceae bacterium BMA10]
MKQRKILLGLLLIINLRVHGQDAPNIIPPSPNATAIQQHGNLDVGTYTGSANVSVPIYTITEKGLSVPISLSYSGSNGIKVQEMASWIGLGWSLGAGGAVSRTIRGRADDEGNGFKSLPSIPDFDISNYQTFYDYAGMVKDGEPDKFFYNVNGLSGSFFIKKNGDVLQIPQKDVKIIPNYNGLKIISFEIIDIDGTSYLFTEPEEVRSRTVGASWTDNAFKVSSWHLTKITDATNSTSIDFIYDSYSTDLYSEFPVHWQIAPSPITNPFNAHQYSHTETNAKRLKEIVFSNGKVVFTATNSRCDFADDKYLSAIEIQDDLGQLIKKFTFDYSYFGANGTVPVSTPCETDVFLNGSLFDGDYYKRLRLDAVREWNKNASESKPSFDFTYYENNWLPSRHSYARDHWGYYNGKNNTSLEPKYKVDVRVLDGSIVHYVVGDADREPDFDFVQAGLLKKITYPTGGYTEFEFEQHQAVNDALPNGIDTKSITLYQEGLGGILNINLIDEPFAEVTMSHGGLTLSQSCDIEVTFRNTTTNAETVIKLFDISDASGSSTITLSPAEYEATYKIIDNVGDCLNSVDVLIQISWNNEVYVLNKNIGGVRVRRIWDYDPTKGGDIYERNFVYTEEDGTASSGVLVTVPRYGRVQTIDHNNTLTPVGWIRSYNTNLPLAVTKGSHVGYSRVTIHYKSGQKINGKSELTYKTAEDFPDYTRGWTRVEGDDRFVWGNRQYDSWPLPPTNSKDWKRGLLDTQIDYRYNNGNYYKVRKQKNDYTFIGQIYDGTNSIPPLLDPETNLVKYIKGVSTACEGAGCNYFGVKFYKLYSGRFELKSQLVTNYHFNDETNFEDRLTEYFYESGNHFQLTRQKATNSDNKVSETLSKYAEDYTTPSTPITQMINKNIVGVAIEQWQKVGGNVIGGTGTKYVYDAVKDRVLPDEIHLIATDIPLTSFSGPSDGQDFVNQGNYELRASYQYDDNGNIKEYTRTGDTPITYIWGYGGTLPVAKIENASASDVETELPGVFNLTMDNLTSAQIQTLRTQLPNAFITTYVYDPLVGMISATDPNELVTTYTYDDFNRLELVRDHEGNILQKVDYHYWKNN